MVANRYKYSITIGFSDTNPVELMLINYLKAVRDRSGEEVKSQIVKAMRSFYEVYAIGENPKSTPEEFEEAMTNCFIELSAHMSRVAAYGKTRHGIKSSPDSWKQFGLLLADSIAPIYPPTVIDRVIPQIVPLPDLPAEKLSIDRADEIDRITALHAGIEKFTFNAQDRSNPASGDKTTGIVNSPVELEEDDYDSDYDSDDDLTDEEYAAKQKSIMKRKPLSYAAGVKPTSAK